MNRNFGKLKDGKLTYAPRVIWRGNDCLCNPTDADYLAQGWIRIIDEKPSEKVGVYYVPNGWEQKDGVIRRRYDERPIVAPPLVYLVEEIIYGLIMHDALQAVKQIVGDYWELFTMRETLEAENDIFKAKFPELKAAIVSSGALTEDEIAEILKDAEVC